MKQTILFAAALLSLFWVSCQKIETTEPTPVNNEICFEFSVADISPDTRAVKTGWVSGDKINIWFDGNFETTPDLVITYNGTFWEAGKLRQGCELTEGSGKLAALYESKNDLTKYSVERYGSSGYLKIGYREVSMVDNEDGKIVLSPSSMMTSCSTTYSLSEGKLTSKLENWGFKDTDYSMRTGFINGLQITITDIPEGEYALNCVANSQMNNYIAIIQSAAVYSSDSSIKANGQDPTNYVSAQASNNEAVFYYMHTHSFEGSGVKTTFTLIPKVNGSYSSSNALIYETTVSLKKRGSYQAAKIAFNKFTSLTNGHEFVDMGSTGKWATMNVGASSETDPGDLIEYPNVNAAIKVWGGNWRLPTHEEWDNLVENCSRQWVRNYKESDMDGMLFTCESNGNTLFIPAVGYYDPDPEYGLFEGVGFYWSSDAKFISFDEPPYDILWYDFSSGLSMSVRPILGN